MPELSHRAKTLEAIEASSIHQSLATPASHVAIARCKTSTLNDPVQAMELLRTVLQPSINEEIRRVLQKYVDGYFGPAAKNARANLGVDAVGERLVEDACVSALENAKTIFTEKARTSSKAANKKAKKVKRKPTAAVPAVVAAQKASGGKKRKVECSSNKSPRPNTDLILVSKTGKPVRREGPKWEPERLTSDTVFILGSKANKALGFGQTRGRLYIKHPELLK
jgi:deoxynucleotidyltransferase terminal-interacting protein 1